MAYSRETLPGRYRSQSIFPNPVIHSSPKNVSNSDCVKPGGSRLIISFNLEVDAFAALFAAVVIGVIEDFSVMAAGIGRTPAEGLEAVACVILIVSQ